MLRIIRDFYIVFIFFLLDSTVSSLSLFFASLQDSSRPKGTWKRESEKKYLVVYQFPLEKGKKIVVINFTWMFSSLMTSTTWEYFKVTSIPKKRNRNF